MNTLPTIILGGFGVFVFYVGITIVRGGYRDANGIEKVYGADGIFAADSIRRESNGGIILIFLGILIIVSVIFA